MEVGGGGYSHNTVMGQKGKDRAERGFGGEEARPRDSRAVVGGKVRQHKADSWVSTLGMQAPWESSEMGKQEEGWVCREDAEARLAQGWRRWERSREDQSRRQSCREGSRPESERLASVVCCCSPCQERAWCVRRIFYPS